MLEQGGNDEVATLAKALPQGRAFEAGLAGLKSAGSADQTRFVEPPVDPIPLAMSPLTRRVPYATASHEQPGPPVGASTRTPEEVRAMLGRYRQGLDDASAGEAPPPEPGDPAGLVADNQGGGGG